LHLLASQHNIASLIDMPWLRKPFNQQARVLGKMLSLLLTPSQRGLMDR